MRIITIEECASTNTTLKEMVAGPEWLPSGTTLRAIKQTAGRGQRGNTWESEPGMNLTFSMVLRPGAVKPSMHFIVSEAIALGVTKFLLLKPGMEHHRVEIKWPNDILVDGRKIAGILIENNLGAEGVILHSIAGIGVNINQTFFSAAAPNAVSLSMLTKEYYDLDILMTELANMINLCVSQIAPQITILNHDNSAIPPIQSDYMGLLWRKSGVHRWKDMSNGEEFDASIVTVALTGQLLLKENDGRMRRYMFKEVMPI